MSTPNTLLLMGIGYRLIHVTNFAKFSIIYVIIKIRSKKLNHFSLYLLKIIDG